MKKFLNVFVFKTYEIPKYTKFLNFNTALCKPATDIGNGEFIIFCFALVFGAL